MEYLTSIDWVLPLRSELLTPLMRAFTELGGLPGLLFLTSVGLWVVHKDLSIRLILLLALGYVVNATLKDSFADPRPDPVYHLIAIGEYGFPSGHSQGAFVLFFALVYELRWRYLWVAAALLALGVGFSRIYLGVHDLEDVLGGFVAGALVLLAYYAALPYGTRLCQRLGLLLLPALYGLVLLWWWLYPTSELGMYPLFAGSLLMGVGTGLLLEARYVKSVEPTGFWQGLRILSQGLLGLVLIAAVVHTLALSLVPIIVSLALWQTLAVPYFFADRSRLGTI